MSTTGPVMTVTDELLAEIEEAAYSSEFGVVVEAQSLREALNELRRLRAENDRIIKTLLEARQYVAFAYNEGMDGAESVGLSIDTAVSAMATQ